MLSPDQLFTGSTRAKSKPVGSSPVTPAQATSAVRSAPLEQALSKQAPSAKASPVKKGSTTPGKANSAVSKAAGQKAAATAYLGDATYQAARGALKSQLDQYGTNLKTQANRYDQTYGQDLGNLGLQDGQGHRFVTPDAGQYTWRDSIAKKGDSFAGNLAAPKQAAQHGTFFNQIDPLTSSGKAYTDQSNDYAARGMMQSSGYLTDHANLGQSFTNQLHNAQLSRNNYLGDLNSQAQAYVGQTSDSLNQARIQALTNYNNSQASNAVRAAAGIKS